MQKPEKKEIFNRIFEDNEERLYEEKPIIKKKGKKFTISILIIKNIILF